MTGILWTTGVIQTRHTHTVSHRHTGRLVCWYYWSINFSTPSTGSRSHRLNFVYSSFCHLLFLFIKTVTQTIIVYTSYWCFLSIPVKDEFCLYQSVIKKMFIYHTSAPVEVSVWLGGRSLWIDSSAFYDSVVWRGVRGLWELHAWAAAEGLGVAGSLAQVT